MNGKPDITGSITFGVIFVLIGALVLMNEFDVINLTWAYLLPIVLITAGIAVIVSSQVKARTEES
jgi:ABC-type glycerol-3-phosphate transport system permease component